MRVIAGYLGGRQFQSPRGQRTHPMSDKARGALFNALGDINNLTVLDPFAGSGALSFEAVSRGAKKAVAIDKDRNAQNAIEANTKQLGLSGKVKLVKASARAWLSTTADKFDLVFMDPPYDDIQTNLMIELAERSTMMVVLSLPPTASVNLSGGFEQIAVKVYGDSQLVFYKRIP